MLQGSLVNRSHAEICLFESSSILHGVLPPCLFNDLHMLNSYLETFVSSSDVIEPLVVTFWFFFTSLRSLHCAFVVILAWKFSRKFSHFTKRSPFIYTLFIYLWAVDTWTLEITSYLFSPYTDQVFLIACLQRSPFLKEMIHISRCFLWVLQSAHVL